MGTILNTFMAVVVGIIMILIASQIIHTVSESMPTGDFEPVETEPPYPVFIIPLVIVLFIIVGLVIYAEKDEGGVKENMSEPVYEDGSKKKSKDEIIAEQNKMIATMKMDSEKKAVELENKKTALVGIRAAQALCLGMFTLGISMGAGDVSAAYGVSISSLSITTTLFGGFGSIICEFFARKAEKW